MKALLALVALLAPALAGAQTLLTLSADPIHYRTLRPLLLLRALSDSLTLSDPATNGILRVESEEHLFVASDSVHSHWARVYLFTTETDDNTAFGPNKAFFARRDSLEIEQFHFPPPFSHSCMYYMLNKKQRAAIRHNQLLRLRPLPQKRK